MAQKFVTYIRVSTDKQGASGLGLEAQTSLVELHARRTGAEIIGAYIEVETATRKGNHRPQLAQALAHCKHTGAVLLIAKLDRLARNVAFVSNLMESGVEFVAADMPTANRLTIHIIAAVAEHEATIISERTKAALSAAKARGVKLGGYRERSMVTAEQRAKSMATRTARAASHSQVIADKLMQFISAVPIATLGQLTQFLNASNFTAPRGGVWTKAQVRRVISRHNISL